MTAIQPRVYTDARVPELEIRNAGDARFTVIESKTRRVLDHFVGFENIGCATVSESFSARRASAYFDSHRADIEADNHDAFRLDQALSHRSVAPDADGVVSTDTVMDAADLAMSLPEGPEKDKALTRVRALACQVESERDEVVRRLLA